MPFFHLLREMAKRPQEYITPQGRVTTNSIEGFRGLALKYHGKKVDLHHSHYAYVIHTLSHDSVQFKEYNVLQRYHHVICCYILCVCMCCMCYNQCASGKCNYKYNKIILYTVTTYAPP